MAEDGKVKKREVIPQQIQEEINRVTSEPESVVIKVGDKNYDVPMLTRGQYKKLMKKMRNQPEDQGEEEALDFIRDWYYELLKNNDKDLKKADLDDMPVYQYGPDFLLKLKGQMFRIPFDSQRK